MGSSNSIPTLVVEEIDGRKLIDQELLLTYLRTCGEIAYWKDGSTLLATIQANVQQAPVVEAGTACRVS